MELINKRFCMVSDKEQMLQALNLNNVPCIELVDPQVCKYPIIGRTFGHHGGKDLSIIHTKEQAIEEGFDYFTKLYAIEKEYMLEIEALALKSVRIPVGQQVVFNEVPIRTESFGWKWQEEQKESFPSDWLNIAIRALYVMGLSHGVVKLGILANETPIITDINRMFKPAPAVPEIKTVQPFTMGADLEFMLSNEGELLPANTFFPVTGPIGCDERQIEQDSGQYALAEIRPEKADTPQELFNNIKKLITDASEMVPYHNIQFRAGSMPFFGYQCGGHIHFGIPISLSLLRALDHYLAVPVALVEDPKTAKRRRKTNHGGLGRYREKPYGFEYISLSAFIFDPKLTLSILCLAQLIAIHHHEMESEFLFDPIIQRAYYKGNKIVLKQLWGDIKKTLMKTTTFLLYDGELTYLFDVIEKGYPYNESCCIRTNWGLNPPQKNFDQGLVIQISKRMRIKYNLTEGSAMHIKAGNRISQAVIHPYPFSFRNQNMVHPSKMLREKLALPAEWNPKLSSTNGVLTLGPIIGILALKPFERQTTYFELLTRLAHEKQMLIYIFEPKDIDWEKELIKGTSMRGGGEDLYPFPAVIYDRLILAKNQKEFIDEVRFKLQSIYHIPFINPVKLSLLTSNKWDTHKLLLDDFKSYLPDTRQLKQNSDIKEMLDHYGEVFLKPIGGTRSNGIIRVIRRPTGIFWIHTMESIFRQLHNFEELYGLSTPLLEKGLYVIQEGIRKKKYKGKNIEIRVYMQKNGMQKWFRTGMVTRLTNEDVLIGDTETNIKVSKMLNELYPDFSGRGLIKKQLATVCRNIVNKIENEVGPFGELVIDFCLDQYDSIKLLELNSKPDNSFSQIGAYQLRNLAGVRLLNYAASIAGYESDDQKV
jgi:hypothetical protein